MFLGIQMGDCSLQSTLTYTLKMPTAITRVLWGTIHCLLHFHNRRTYMAQPCTIFLLLNVGFICLLLIFCGPLAILFTE